MAFEQTGLQNIAKVSPAAQMASLFQTQLIIQQEEGIPLKEALISKCQGDSLDEGADTYALTLEIFIAPSQLRVLTTFDSKVIEPNAVQKLLELFHRVLNQLDNAAPRQLLSDIKTTIPHNLAQYAITTTESLVEAENSIKEYAATQAPNSQPMSETELQMQKANELKASQPAELPCDKARPAALSGQVKTQNVCIQGRLYDLLQQVSKKLEVTPFVVLLAAFRATHFFLTGVADATIGIPNANRGRWQDKDVVGLLVNMQCIRSKIGQETFEAFVRQVQATMLAAFHRQDTPFELIVSKLGIQRDLSRHPLFQITMADHSQLAFEKFELEGVETEAIVPTLAAVFDLQLHIYQGSGFLRVETIFSTDLYESGTMENVIQYWHAVLERGLSDPDATIKSLGA
ncbi:hypothetical protein ARSEF1564_009034 [Beauveria bassiana]